MQTNLRALFAGRREAVEVPAKRGPGRPPTLRQRDEAAEQPDAVVEAISSMPDQPEAYDERLRLRHRKRKAECLQGDEVLGSHVTALVEASGQSVAELRMPGSNERDGRHEGPQVKLKLRTWLRKTHEKLGGTDDVHETLVMAVAERWNVPRFDIVRVLRNEAKWKKQCEDRGVTAHGLKKDECQLPVFLRKAKRSKGVRGEPRVLGGLTS